MTEQVRAPTLKLNSGYEIPAIGLGTSLGERQESIDAIVNAIEVGYRHIDTATIYKNEDIVGEAIIKSKVPRSEIYVNSKLWCTDLLPERVRPAVVESLKKLQLDYVDSYLIHWPFALKHPQTSPGEQIPVNLVDTWKELEKLVDEGLIRTIGVSNFSVKKLQQILDSCKIKPAINQVEMHPYLAQNELKKLCDEHNIILTGYTPLGRFKEPSLATDPVVVKICEKYNKTASQVILSWSVQRGTCVIPRSTNKTRQLENLSVFQLDQTDIDQINSLDRNLRHILPKEDWNIKDFEFDN